MATTEQQTAPLTVTASAAAKITQLMAEETEVTVLRVAIAGGGCSGFQYQLGFDSGTTGSCR